jgi:hypothetical protein
MGKHAPGKADGRSEGTGRLTVLGIGCRCYCTNTNSFVLIRAHKMFS